MIPNIIRLQEQMKELRGVLEAEHAQVEMLSARVAVMHAHVENLIERVYELEGGDGGELSFIERIVAAQIARRDAKLKEDFTRLETDLNRTVHEAKCNCGWGGVHDPNNKGCVLHSYFLTCRKCFKPISSGQWRFGSRAAGWEHMGDDCER